MATTTPTTIETGAAPGEAASGADTRGGVRGVADKAIETARDTASQAFETTRDTARGAARRTADALDTSPLAVLAGGVALGVLIGVLIPRLARERDMLAPLGKKLADSVTSAAQAAREAGKAEIEALIPNAEGTKERVTQLVGTVIDAAKNAGKR